MITVNTKERPNVRVKLDGGAFIEFRPFSTLGHGAGSRVAFSILAAGEDPGTASVAYTIALARWGAVAWEGIGDEEDAPLPLTPDNLEALLTQRPDIYQRVDAEYAAPALRQETEKNVSSPAQHGTSPASRRAKRAPRAQASAGATTVARAAKSARTAPTS